MEKLTSLNLSFDRVLIQLVIPGLIASFPYLLVFTDIEFKSLAFEAQETNTLSVLLIIFVALIVGLFIENIGSQIEVHCYDRRQKKNSSNYEQIWDQYLQLSFENEPIGQRYIRNILFRMKFELSMAVALIMMAGGFWIYNSIYSIQLHPVAIYIGLYISPILTALYLIFCEGWSGSKLLHKVRGLLIERYGKQ